MTNPPALGRRSLTTSAIAVAAASVLVGCGGGDGGDSGSGTDATSSGSAPSTTPTGAASSASGSTSPSSSPSGTSATSAPATSAGPTLTLDSLTVQAPTGWVVHQDGAPQAIANDPSLQAGEGELLVMDLGSLSGDTLDSQARVNLRSINDLGDFEATRQANRVLAGVEGYVLTGSSTDGRVKAYYEFGTVAHGHDVQIQVQFLLPTPDASAVTESILATVQWL